MLTREVCQEILVNLSDLREAAIGFLERRGVVRQDAEDIFHDALLAFAEGLDRFDPHFGSPAGTAPGNGRGRVSAIPCVREEPDTIELSPELIRRARAWFWGILHNKQRAHFRQRARWTHDVLEQQQEPPDIMVIRLRDILKTLPAQDEEILVIRFVEERELSDVAEHFGFSVPTAHRRVRSALEAARAVL